MPSLRVVIDHRFTRTATVVHITLLALGLMFAGVMVWNIGQAIRDYRKAH